VWVGELTGEIGTVSVTWNAACDPRVFQLDVTLADDSDSNSHSITTLPCSGDTEGVPSCLWTAKVTTTQRDEYDPVDTRRVNTSTSSSAAYRIWLRSISAER
jgi:hypothetical protein